MRRRILVFLAFGCLLGIIGAIVALTALGYAQQSPVPPPPPGGVGVPAPVPGKAPAVGVELPRGGAPLVAVQAKGDKPSDWAAVPWRWAIAEGIADGRNPQGPCTREMVITWFYRLDRQWSGELTRLRNQVYSLEATRPRSLEGELAPPSFIPSSASESPSPSGLLVSDVSCYRTPETDLGLDSLSVTPIRVVGKINNTGSEPVQLVGDVLGVEGYDGEGHLVVAEVLSTTPREAQPPFSFVPLEVISGKSQIGPTHVAPGGYATFQTAILGAPSIANIKVRVLR